LDIEINSATFSNSEALVPANKSPEGYTRIVTNSKKAIRFNGTSNSYADFGTRAVAAPNNFTLEFDIYPASTSTRFQGVIGNDPGSANTRALSVYVTNTTALEIMESSPKGCHDLSPQPKVTGNAFREIAKQVGAPVDGTNLRDILEYAISMIAFLQNPLIIFDEGDKLTDRSLPNGSHSQQDS
jgi:hypothetical protein